MALGLDATSSSGTQLASTWTAPTTVDSTNTSSTATTRADTSTTQPDTASTQSSAVDATPNTQKNTRGETRPVPITNDKSSAGSVFPTALPNPWGWPAPITRTRRGRPGRLHGPLQRAIDRHRPMLNILEACPKGLTTERHAPVSTDFVKRCFPDSLNPSSSQGGKYSSRVRPTGRSKTSASNTTTTASADAELASQEQPSKSTGPADVAATTTADTKTLLDFQLDKRSWVQPSRANDCDETLKNRVNTARNYLLFQRLGSKVRNDKRSFTCSYADLTSDQVPEDMRLTETELTALTDATLNHAVQSVEEKEILEWFNYGLGFHFVQEEDRINRERARDINKSAIGSSLHPDTVVTADVRKLMESEVGCRAATWKRYADGEQLEPACSAVVTGRLLCGHLGDVTKYTSMLGKKVVDRANIFNRFWESREKTNANGESEWPDENVEQSLQALHTFEGKPAQDDGMADFVKMLEEIGVTLPPQP